MAGNNNETALFNTLTGALVVTLDAALTMKTITNASNQQLTLNPGTGGALTMASSDASTPTINVTAGNTANQVRLILGNALGISGTQGLTINVSGTNAATTAVRVSTSSTFGTLTGTFTQSGGVLSPQAANVFPAAVPVNLLGAQLQLFSSTRNQTVRGLSGDSAASVTNASNGTTGTITFGGASTLAGGTFPFSGAIGSVAATDLSSIKRLGL